MKWVKNFASAQSGLFIYFLMLIPTNSLHKNFVFTYLAIFQFFFHKNFIKYVSHDWFMFSLGNFFCTWYLSFKPFEMFTALIFWLPLTTKPCCKYHLNKEVCNFSHDLVPNFDQSLQQRKMNWTDQTIINFLLKECKPEFLLENTQRAIHLSCFQSLSIFFSFLSYHCKS